MQLLDKTEHVACVRGAVVGGRDTLSDGKPCFIRCPLWTPRAAGTQLGPSRLLDECLGTYRVPEPWRSWDMLGAASEASPRLTVRDRRARVSEVSRLPQCGLVLSTIDDAVGHKHLLTQKGALWELSVLKSVARPE